MKALDKYGSELKIGDIVSVYHNNKEIVDKAEVVYIEGDDHIFLRYDNIYYSHDDYEVHNGGELIRHLDERDIIK